MTDGTHQPATEADSSLSRPASRVPRPDPIRPYRGKMPKIAADAFVADNAVIIGDVEIGSGSSVWFGVVIRGDSSPIRIGERSNVQDGTIIHSDADAPTTIGNDVTIGHRAIVHGTTIGDGAQVSMGAIVLSRSTVGPNAIVGAGALVPEDAVVAPGSIVMGVPAKHRRDATEADLARTREAARHYAELGREYGEPHPPAPSPTGRGGA